jgi:glycerol 3-phosphatase-2
MAWLLDLDGVVWLAGEAIPGAVEAIVFVTNSSNPTREAQEAALAAIGVSAAGDVVTSAMAAATLVAPGDRVHVAGGPGVVQALEGRGAVIASVDVAAVVVGLHREFDYEGMALASSLVRGGAQLIGTNDDATYPTPGGQIPGGGAILAAIAYASGATPVVAGKPNAPMVDAVRAHAGDGPHVMVGDRASTDGAFARRLGATFALVLSGVTSAGDLPVEPAPDVVGADLAAVVDALL